MSPITPVIVTGAGRSGTSAVARVLHESGFSMGREFSAPSEFNALGFYEELPVLRVNDAIIMDCGIDRWGSWPSRAKALAEAEKYAAEMDRLAPGVLDGGWKDPRFCLTLEAWLPHLPAKPKVVVCLRSPVAQVESGLRPYGVQFVDEARRSVENQWRRYNERLLEFIEDFELESTCVEYDELLAKPEDVVAGLSEFVEHPLDCGFVEPALRHHAGPVPEEFAGLYRQVRALEAGRAERAYPPASNGPPGLDEAASHRR